MAFNLSVEFEARIVPAALCLQCPLGSPPPSPCPSALEGAQGSRRSALLSHSPLAAHVSTSTCKARVPSGGPQQSPGLEPHVQLPPHVSTPCFLGRQLQHIAFPHTPFPFPVNTGSNRNTGVNLDPYPSLLISNQLNAAGSASEGHSEPPVPCGPLFSPLGCTELPRLHRLGLRFHPQMLVPAGPRAPSQCPPCSVLLPLLPQGYGPGPCKPCGLGTHVPSKPPLFRSLGGDSSPALQPGPCSPAARSLPHSSSGQLISPAPSGLRKNMSSPRRPSLPYR